MPIDLLALEHASVSYDARCILGPVELALRPCDILTVCGPSGAGKTTLLLALAGLIPLAAGIRRLSPSIETRAVIYVPQHDTLLPWMSLRRNLELGMLLRRRVSTPRLEATAATLNAAGFMSKAVRQLSGGMRKRAALVRAFCAEPSVLLLDEPFNNLDIADRRRLETYLREWIREDLRAVVCVTHDIGQAVALGDRIGVVHVRSASTGGARLELFDVPSSMLAVASSERRTSREFVALVEQIEALLV